MVHRCTEGRCDEMERAAPGHIEVEMKDRF